MPPGPSLTKSGKKECKMDKGVLHWEINIIRYDMLNTTKYF